MSEEYVIGLDLGQTQDYTALAVLQRVQTVQQSDYLVRHLKRYPLGTPYTAIVPSVACLAGSPILAGKSTLVVDQTGVGRPLVEMLLREPGIPRVVPVTITSGHAVTLAADGSRHVPKKELVTALQLLLQGRRLRIAKGLPEAQVLTEELMNFRIKITAAAHETFGVWRQGQHDDLVLAVALAGWWAEREPSYGPNPVGTGDESLLANAPPGVFLT
jgi:hypothetical protein